MTSDEKLANETIAFAEEITTDAKREIARLDALIGAATNADDFDAIGFFLIQQSLEQSRLDNAAGMRANALELKSAVGQRH